MEQVYKQFKNGTNSTSGIYMTRFHDGRYLLLLGNRELQNFKIPYE